jgi:hypothetical protein
LRRTASAVIGGVLGTAGQAVGLQGRVSAPLPKSWLRLTLLF